MSDLITRTARLVPYAKRPKQVPSFVTAYAYEPLPNDPGAELGSLYVVMEVLVSGRASEEVADLIIETVGERYYNNPETTSLPLDRFEAAIKAANQELSEHVNRGNAAWIGKLSAVIAVQIGAELHVAQTGSAEAFLYRGKSATRITSQGPNRPATPAKTFGSIASGQLEVDDRLLLATPALIHQVPLSRLQNVISSSSPNLAIAEITQLLGGTSTDRIAALVIEVTTPELAALQVRSEEPDEIQLGMPENPIEAAKMVATPLAQSTMASSKKVASAAQVGIQRAKPRVQAASTATVQTIRSLLESKSGQKYAVIAATIAVVLIGAGFALHAAATKNAKIFAEYQHIYANFQKVQQAMNTGDKSTTRHDLVSIQQQLASLKAKESTINQRLQKSALPEAEPGTFDAFSALIAEKIDEIDGLVKVNATTIANFTAKNAHPTQFQLSGSNAYVFDSGSKSIWIINTTTGTIKSSAADLSKLGDVTSTTLSANNDGIYILTKKPSVWFYRFDSNTVTEQSIAFGQWPDAKAIGSYATNLYLLGDTTIYKHVRTATGFSPKSHLLDLPADQQNATALAVDGSIYILSPTSLKRYLGGILEQSLTIPEALSGSTDMRLASGGSFLISSSESTKRVGIWTIKNSTVSFDKQVEANGLKELHGATYDSKSGSIIALADNRLIRLAIKP